MTTITLDNGVTGGSMATIGDDPMYHHKEHTVFGAPLTQELTEIYADAVSVKIHPSSVWNGMDILPIFNSSTSEMDIWFGNPFRGGLQITIDVSGVNTTDLTGGAVAGYDFRPERLFVVGDRIVAYCSVYENSASRLNKIAILSHDMDDLAAETGTWTIHFVTNEYGTNANNVGGLWPISAPMLIDGSYWCVVCDYDSDAASGKEGGQAWLLEIDTDGVPQGMVRLYTRDGGSSEHWHGGLLVSTATGWRALFHIGDSAPQILFRDITDITTYADNATVDAGSGIGGLYRVSNASATDWGTLTVGAGVDEGTSLSQSIWENAFLLLTDPNDDSKFLYGGDTSGGMVKLMEFDSNDVAIGRVVFNPVGKVKQLISSDVAPRFDVFFVSASEDRQTIVANATNELDQGEGAGTYSGIILSTDGGQTWGWIWRGDRTNGVAILSDGRVIASSNISTLSLIEITPGAQIKTQPGFFGFRPTNLLSNAAGQTIIGDGNNGGGVTVTSVGSSPELALPSIVHGEEVFKVDQFEGSGKPLIEPVNVGMIQDDVTGSNIYMSLWVRKMNPASSSEADRMALANSFNMEFPGAIVDPATGSLVSSPKHSTQDWIRLVGMLDGDDISSLPFNADPSDLRSRIQSPGLSVASGRFEVFYESIVIDYDRPPLPYNDRTASGVSSGKFTELGLGEAWTVLVVMQVPEECWDSWTGDESFTWDGPVSIFTLSDQSDTNWITFDAELESATTGGNGTPIVDGVFDWGFSDSDDPTPTTVSDNPQRTMPVVVAISKDGTGALQYAIGTPDGVQSGVRAFPIAIDADTLRFSDINETEALEMYVHQISTLGESRTAAELETLVSDFSLEATPEIVAQGERKTMLSRPFPSSQSL